MSVQRIKQLLQELETELQHADDMQPQTRDALRKLRDDIRDLVDPQVDSSETTVLDDAIALEASFAASHPVAEKLLRELINSLSKIGI